MAGNPVIITRAPTGGIHTPTMSSALPITPDQIAEGLITPSNAAPVQKIRTIVEALGLTVATPAQEGERLGPNGVANVDF